MLGHKDIGRKDEDEKDNETGGREPPRLREENTDASGDLCDSRDENEFAWRRQIVENCAGVSSREDKVRDATDDEKASEESSADAHQTTSRPRRLQTQESGRSGRFLYYVVSVNDYAAFASRWLFT
jgi:hypothetical protein